MHIENMHRMMEELSEYMCSHKDAIDPQTMGAVADMLKDLACATKECQEARYYESVSRAMESYGENPRMGYNPNRDSRGRYSRGYTGQVMYADPSDDPTPDGQRINHRLVDDRPGYMPMSMVPSERMRYDQRDMDEEYDPRYGRTFNDYRRAKRHYTETRSDSDRQKMRDKTNEHVMETMATMREMFDDADPELKKRMKADMVKLTQEMSV